MGELILDGHKLNWHKDRVDAWLRGERIAPITVDCALTRRCTYRCIYCYGQLQANDEKLMSKDVISRFLDDAAKEDKEYVEIWKKLGNFWHYMLPILSERFNKHAMF